VGAHAQRPVGPFWTPILGPFWTPIDNQITSTTLWRWQQDPKLDFPEPVKLNGRNMWTAEDVHAWERKRATRRGAA
ncbi:helix-turn-helix transcriptional regulator, partial [Methylorubrum aminovorans]